MKQLLIFFLIITFNVFADDYIKEARDYAGFGGIEKDMREETIYKVEAGKKIKVGSRISKIKPYELRELEIGGKYWLKEDPTTNDIKDKFDSLIVLTRSTTKKASSASNCEEVTEQYVICNGDKYVRDLRNNNQLGRDAKKLEDFTNVETLNLNKDAVSK